MLDTLQYPAATAAVTTVVAVVGVVAGGSMFYLLVLLCAAALRRTQRSGHKSPEVAIPGSPTEISSIENGTLVERIAVVIPAHNEEMVLAATLKSLQAQEYPSDRYRVVVVADNCTDSTSAIACEHDAVVLERNDTSKRGKGYALEWAFERLLGPNSPVDRAGDPVTLFAIVDADTWVAPDFLRIMTERVQEETTRSRNGRPVALQGRYGVLNPETGWRAALMTAAFDLFNHVKPMGADLLGLTVGLKGNGMVFQRAVLEQARWQGSSITEDIDYGLDLLQNHGIRIGYVPEARVLAQMPETAEQAASQRERWERGRYRLIRERAPRLFSQGLAKGDVRLSLAALDLSIPPLAELAGLIALWGLLIGAGLLIGSLAAPVFWSIAFGLAAVGMVVYVFGGLRVAGAVPEAYQALLFAPVYIAWKFALYALGSITRKFGTAVQNADGAEEWVRTARIPVSATMPSPASSRTDEH
ncbi:MAG: glycosyltransferase family 2 protein [Armatimonadaceae bacterium]